MGYEDLKILDELRAKGSITEEEYQREKEKIFNKNNHSTSFSSGKPLWGLEEKTYLMLMHLSQFAGFVVPFLGYIAPVLMWISNKDTHVNVDKHGKNIINFLLSCFIYAVISCFLIIILIGIPLLLLLGVLYIVFIIMAAVKANKGEYWEYPLTIKFLS